MHEFIFLLLIRTNINTYILFSLKRCIYFMFFVFVFSSIASITRAIQCDGVHTSSGKGFTCRVLLQFYGCCCHMAQADIGVTAKGFRCTFVCTATRGLMRVFVLLPGALCGLSYLLLQRDLFESSCHHQKSYVKVSTAIKGLAWSLYHQYDIFVFMNISFHINYELNSMRLY